MAITYTAIASVTVGSGGTTSMSFSSIPQSYTDLLILGRFRTNRNDSYYGNCCIEFNGLGDGAANYVSTAIRTLGTSTIQSFNTVESIQFGSNTRYNTTNNFSSACFYITNYTSSNYKSISIETVTENNNTDMFPYLVGGRFLNTNPITSISFRDRDTNLLLQHSTATLYGIKKS
jgi:hypothetical protein